LKTRKLFIYISDNDIHVIIYILEHQSPFMPKMNPKELEKRTTELIHQFSEKERTEAISIIKSVLHKELFALNAGHNELVCPECKKDNFIKYGHDKFGKQRYKCKECGRIFIEYDCGEILKYTKLDESVWMDFAPCFVDGLSCDITAEKIGVSHPTAWFMRIRTALALYKNLPSFQLMSGNSVHLDEIYFRESFKGVSLKKYGGQMPRPPLEETQGQNKRGISNDKICVITAINDNNDIFFDVVCRGAMTSDICKKALQDVIVEGCIVNTDKHHSYSKVLKSLDVAIHNRFDSDDHEKLKPVNKLHSHIRHFFSKFKQVSTKWLFYYLVYFKWIREFSSYKGRTPSIVANQISTGDYEYRRSQIPFIDIPFRDANLNPIKTYH